MPHYLAFDPFIRFTITPLTNPPLAVPQTFVERMLLLAVEERFVLTAGHTKDILAALRGTTVIGAGSVQDAAGAFALRVGAAMQKEDQPPASPWTVEMMAATWWRWMSPAPHAVLGAVRSSPGGSQWSVQWPSNAAQFRADVWLEFSIREVAVS